MKLNDTINHEHINHYLGRSSTVIDKKNAHTFQFMKKWLNESQNCKAENKSTEHICGSPKLQLKRHTQFEKH